MQRPSVPEALTKPLAATGAVDFQDDLMMEVAGDGLGAARDTQSRAQSSVREGRSSSVFFSCGFTMAKSVNRVVLLYCYLGYAQNPLQETPYTSLGAQV